MPWIQTFFFLQFESLQSCDFNAATPHQHLALELRQVSSNLQDMADSVCLPENVISIPSEDESESVAIDGSVSIAKNDSQAFQYSASSVNDDVGMISDGNVSQEIQCSATPASMQQPVFQFSAEEIVSKKRKKSRCGKGKKSGFLIPNPGKQRRKQQQEKS